MTIFTVFLKILCKYFGEMKRSSRPESKVRGLRPPLTRIPSHQAAGLAIQEATRGPSTILGLEVAVVINRWIFLFVQSNDYNHKKGEIPLQRRVSLDTRKGFVEKCFPSLLPGRPGWGTPASGMGSQGKRFVSSLLLAARSTASGSAPSHSAGQSPRGGRTMPRQIAVGARGTAESPCVSFRTARERSDTSAHWLASLAPGRTASWGLVVCTVREGE